MPKGIRVVNWQDPASKDRLLLAIIASHDIKLSNKKVAEAFNVPGVNADMIAKQMSLIRKKAKDLAINATTAPSVNTESGSNVENSTPGCEDQSAAGRESTHAATAVNSPFTSTSTNDRVVGGRVTKRQSSRTTAKKSYSNLDNALKDEFDDEVNGVAGGMGAWEDEEDDEADSEYHDEGPA